MLQGPFFGPGIFKKDKGERHTKVNLKKKKKKELQVRDHYLLCFQRTFLPHEQRNSKYKLNIYYFTFK